MKTSLFDFALLRRCPKIAKSKMVAKFCEVK
jgi:hypothetical protein